MHPLDISLFRNKLDRNPEPLTLEWAELVSLLTTFDERQEKDGRLWSPVSYQPNSTRGNANVIEVCCLVLDFDSGIAPGPFRQKWERWEYVLHSTFSHSQDYPKWRAIFPLAAPVPAAEWPAVYQKFAANLGEGHADPACKDASRIYYLPACSPEGVRFATARTRPLALA